VNCPGAAAMSTALVSAAIAQTSACHRHRVVESELFPSTEGETMFGSIGIPELIIILVIILLLFGASRLPEIGRGLGKGIKNFKESTRDEADGAKHND